MVEALLKFLEEEENWAKQCLSRIEGKSQFHGVQYAYDAQIETLQKIRDFVKTYQSNTCGDGI